MGGVLQDVDEEAWRRWAAAQKRALALDYDGTLAPFQVDRMKARPASGALDAVRALATSMPVALVSGRPIAELENLTEGLRVAMIGAHGWEFREANGRRRDHQPDRERADALTEAQALAEALAPPGMVERKIASVAVHARPMPPDEAPAVLDAIRSAWAGLLNGLQGLEIRDYNGGIELRLTGRDKGVALREWLREYATGAHPLYIGDDETDEDAFRAIRDDGFGVRVGATLAGSAARARLPDCEAVTRFLTALPESPR